MHKMTEEKVIEVSGLTKKFGAFTAVNDISFNVRRGEIFGFLGANGAGKTTAMRMLCGLSKPTAGQGMVAGYDIMRQQEDIKRHIGYMSQHFSLYGELTVWENLNLFSTIYGMTPKQIRSRGDEVFRLLGMENMRDSRVRDLPVGWKQKLAFTVATVHDPAIVFLDEPTGGVDPLTRRKFWELIYRESSRGLTVFVTTHYLDEAEYCNRVSIMVDGRIEVLDTPQKLKERYHATTMDEVFRKVAAENGAGK